LHPVVEEPKVIAALVDALCEDQMGRESFVRFYTVHHLASRIWKDLDLRLASDSSGNCNTRAVVLLETILKKAREPTSLADLARYHQDLRGNQSPFVPPECYEEDQEVMKKRKEWLISVGKKEIWERLEEAIRDREKKKIK